MDITTNEGIALLSLIQHASLPVQLVMLLLMVASVLSWTMIFRKWFAIKSAGSMADRFEAKFWSGANLNQMFTEQSKKDANATGMASIFVEGFREYKRLSQETKIEPMDILEGVQRAMRVGLSREIDYLETHLSFLATVGSTSPYVGLFGTVWGIMNSFRSLGMVQQATIAHVAPGIAEALIATAIGLFAAIPAVIAYNRYSNKVERQHAIFQAARSAAPRSTRPQTGARSSLSQLRHNSLSGHHESIPAFLVSISEWLPLFCAALRMRCAGHQDNSCLRDPPSPPVSPGPGIQPVVKLLSASPLSRPGRVTEQ